MRTSTVKLVFSFCANATLKDIACIVNRSLSRFPRAVAVLFCKQKLLNRLSITHDHRLRTHCILSDPLTPPRGRLMSNLARKYTGSIIFTACIVYTVIVC